MTVEEQPHPFEEGSCVDVRGRLRVAGEGFQVRQQNAGGGPRGRVLRVGRESVVKHRDGVRPGLLDVLGLAVWVVRVSGPGKSLDESVHAEVAGFGV
ncbi:hypothetical protein, partial [Streptomyces netropsis]